ncbi:MAG: hypothetical protein U0736_02380 [Gemmataceae bacterium]
MRFDAATVTSVRVRAHVGDDRVDAGSLPQPVRIHGADGNDTLIGGQGDDTLDGGSGADALTGGPGTNQLVGGVGLDRVAETGAPSFVLTTTRLTATGT